MGAVTDSGSEVRADVEGKEGIGNLIVLYAALSGETVAKVEQRYAGKGYGAFKRDLAELAVGVLAPFRTPKANGARLKAMLAAGNRKAGAVAAKKLKEVRGKTGLV
jgi:tryptophanyl-tRNA synthetase